MQRRSCHIVSLKTLFFNFMKEKHFFLIILIFNILRFGVVCAFVTNEHIKDGVEQLPENVTVNLNDVDLYLDNTDKEVDHLLVTNFNELKEFLNNILDGKRCEGRD